MSSSIGKKVAMALSGMFLMFFLLQHMSINIISIFSASMFNQVSHFMGTNLLVQGLLQPVLMFGVIFHLGMGIKLELENRAARPIKYLVNKGSANSSWMSRNMIITGITVMLFLGLHLYDFWVHEMQIKYLNGDMTGLINPDSPDSGYRYWIELHGKFHDPVRVLIYVVSFIFLALHLLHGFQSSFQSVGFNHKRYTPIIKKLASAYAVLVPIGFVIVAVFHFVTQ
jgi:succinate dehydrogenase / fumarate reductase cytochrome b subunit